MSIKNMLRNTFKTVGATCLSVMVGMQVSLGATSTPQVSQGVCDLITELKGVFNVLRVMAFVGAAFILMAWAWGWIMEGKIDLKDADRKKFIAMAIGLLLLFLVGAVLTALMSTGTQTAIGCAPELKTW